MKTDVTPLKKGLQQIWMAWERLFEKVTRLRSAYCSQYGICKLFVIRHSGKSIECENGTWIHAGEWVGELHIDNKQILRLLSAENADRTALAVGRMARQSLRQIGAAMASEPELHRVKALTGITLLHRGIIHGLGFERHELKAGGFRKLTTLYLQLLLRVLHPNGRNRISGHDGKLVPMRLVLTRESLLARYAQPGMHVAKVVDAGAAGIAGTAGAADAAEAAGAAAG